MSVEYVSFHDRSSSGSSCSSHSSSSPMPPIPAGAAVKFDVPRVEVGAPCLKCGDDCAGLLLHVWRKTCINCKCPRDFHKPNPVTTTNKADDSEKNLSDYVWFPNGITSDIIIQYMKSLPPNCVPLRGTAGEEQRSKLYLEQLPRHDADPSMCHKMTDVEKKRLVKISEKWKNKSCGVGDVTVANGRKACLDCKELIDNGDICITSTDKFPIMGTRHPSCFKCYTCRCLLVDLIFYFDELTSKIYCGRHYAELKVPRCFGCDELIVADSFTQAEGKMWHKEHFCCEKCDTMLQGKKYQKKNGHVFCQSCFDDVADVCHRCGRPIKDRKFTQFNLSFHEDCFTCKRCRENLMDRKYYSAEEDIVCVDCMRPITQCSKCKEGIFAHEKHLQHENHMWHVDCFICTVCNKSLVGEGFHEHRGNLMCPKCYLQQVSKKCHVCTKSIVGKGIQYNSKTYHKDCFQCSSCRNLLTDVGGKVSEKQGSLYCEECVVKFAKICEGCMRPIVSRHTVYKRKYYHVECFKCTNCGTSIGKQSFYETSLNDLLCEQCAKGNT